MTDPIARRFTTPTGRIHWIDPMTDEFREKLTEARDRTWRGSFTAKIDNPPHVQAAFALAFGYDATPFLVGHDPQKLLPSPERLERERLEWYDNLTKLFTQRDVTDAVLSVYIDFDKPSGVALRLPMISPGDKIDVSRWNDPDSDPLDDIQRWMKTFDKRTPTFEHKVAIISTDADYAGIEARLMASLANPSVRCIVLDIDSAGGDFLSPRNYQAEMYALGALESMKQPVETAAGIRDKSYLKHDPSKKHKRRKRK